MESLVRTGLRSLLTTDTSHLHAHPPTKTLWTGTIDASNNYKLYTTGGKGSFGSRNDEERSELRNVTRNAKPVRRRVFERSMRPQGNLQACLSGCFDHSSGQSGRLPGGHSRKRAGHWGAPCPGVSCLLAGVCALPDRSVNLRVSDVNT
jgi:hypothetical protein